MRRFIHRDDMRIGADTAVADLRHLARFDFEHRDNAGFASDVKQMQLRVEGQDVRILTDVEGRRNVHRVHVEHQLAITRAARVSNTTTSPSPRWAMNSNETSYCFR